MPEGGGDRPHVLQVGKYYPPVHGGIENNTQALAVALSKRYRVTVVVFNTRARTTREDIDGVHVVRVGTLGRVLSTEIAPGFFSWIHRFRRADLIHLHTPNPLGELACLAAPASARLVVTYHSDVVRQRILGRANRLLLHRILRRADRIIAYTRRYMETSPVISRYADKCAIIPHGVELDEFEPNEAVRARADALRRRHGPRIVLFVGRLVYYKGVDVLLDALAAVPDSRLLVVGDGPMRPSLGERAGRLGVTDRVVFLGRLTHEEKLAAYHASDLLALPATHRSEAFGQVQVEAMACRRPVISTDIDSGVPFVNKDRETGIIVEPMNAKPLAVAMNRILDDPGLAARMGEAGRRRVETLFSRDVMIQDSLALYEDLLSGRVPVARRSGAMVP